jgi:uncharacterized protein YggE
MEDDVIVVTGSATSTTKPDRVTGSWGVVSEEATASAAFARSEQAAKKVIASLYKLGIKDESLSTDDISVDIRYRKEYDNTSGIIGYRCTRGYRLKLVGEQMKLAETALRTALENGVTNISGLEWSISDNASRDLKRDAMLRAQKAAEEKANELAQQLGYTRGRLLSIEEGVRREYTPRPRSKSSRHGAQMSAMARAESQERDVSSMPLGSVTASAEVTLTYQLGNDLLSVVGTKQSANALIDQRPTAHPCEACGLEARVKMHHPSGWRYYCNEACHDDLCSRP